jgi:hypothetical protein
MLSTWTQDDSSVEGYNIYLHVDFLFFNTISLVVYALPELPALAWISFFSILDGLGS